MQQHTNTPAMLCPRMAWSVSTYWPQATDADIWCVLYDTVHHMSYAGDQIMTNEVERHRLSPVHGFYRAAYMQGGLSYGKRVRLSVVRPSHAWIVTKRTKVLPTLLHPYEREIHLVFWQAEWLVGDVPFYLKFWRQTEPVASKTTIFNRYSLVAAQTVGASEKSSIMTNRSSVRAFQWA